jgi:hypothetical protein
MVRLGSKFHVPYSSKRLTCSALLFCGMVAACGQQDQLADINLDANAAFVVIPRVASSETRSLRQRALKASGVIDQGGVGDDFYLAINRKELGTDKRWFLSSYLKQYHPGAVAGGAARSMGTRVVSFKNQNGKLVVLDTDSRKAASEVFAPDVVVDAYPVVAYAPFDRLPGSSAFVLFDPSAGANEFAVLGDPWAGGSEPVKFSTELSYMARYRSIADGITYEQVFSGYADLPINDDPVEVNAFRASGTLGIGIRRYAETTGFTKGPIVQGDGQDTYFRSDPVLVKNQGFYSQSSIKWGVSATQPINWVISNVVDILQADPAYAGYDIYGAMAKGVTGWNSVFGYDALKVRKGTKDDSFADDDTNMIIVDTDPSYGAAFANWRSNPNTGEIRGASVYINSLWLEIADIIFDDDPVMPLAMGTMKKPKVPVIFWRPMGHHEDGCEKWAPIYEGSRGPKMDLQRPGLPIPKEASLTKKQKVEQYLTHVVMHEVGHTLGLRHNFKGSLSYDPTKNLFSSSVMEYIDDFDSIFAATPQSYDIAIVKYLYGISMALPTDKFCNDAGVAIDPECSTFDRTSDPYTTETFFNYGGLLKDYLDGLTTVSPNNTLNEMNGYVRNGRTAAARMKAWNDIVDLMGYSLRVGKVDPTKLMTVTGYGARVDAMMRRVIQRLFVDDAALRGRFGADPSDTAIRKAAIAEAKGMMENTDKIRSVDTRRMLAGWFKKLQTYEAHLSLAKGANQLDNEIKTGMFTDPKEAAKAEDTLRYMDSLLKPYLTGADYNADW